MKQKISYREFLSSEIALITFLSLVKLLIHFYANGGYGRFRDEMYFMTCSEHLAWGYVDQPPLVAVVGKIERVLFGDSLFAWRLFPAIAGALKVFLTGMIARELGGKRFAVALACICVIVAPAYLVVDNYFSMNSFEPLFWMMCAYLAILIIKGGRRSLWLWFGIVAGGGLLNKHSMLFFGFGFVIALLLTPHRKFLASKWLWFGGAAAFLIFLPNLIWEIKNDFPTIEILHNVQQGRDVRLSPLDFFAQQILLLHPFTFPVWLAGLYFYLISKQGRSSRVLGWTYVVMFATFIALHGKNYYLASAYPMLLAAGGVQFENLFARLSETQSDRIANGLKFTFVFVLILGGIILAPLALPVLPVETFIAYSNRLGISEPKTENHRMGKLPQHYADMFGWENMAATVGKVYNSLSLDERAKCPIFTDNYGEAGAIDWFGAKYNLPKAISGHNNYFLWGAREYTGEVMIILAHDDAKLKQSFERVEDAAVINDEYAMPYETDLHVYLCHNLKMPLSQLWSRVKHYD